jgi:hypothetical protein
LWKKRKVAVKLITIAETTVTISGTEPKRADRFVVAIPTKRSAGSA